MKEIEIMNYAGKKVPVEIKNFNNVVKLIIEIVSGDEILHVLYKDYIEETYDSCYMLDDFRIMDFFDDKYTIYDITKNINCIDSWSKRKDSYDYSFIEEQE